MKYVITGGAGFIGSHLTKALVKQDHDVTVIDNLQTGKEENLKSIKDKIVFVKGSILDNELLQRITNGIDGLFHQAALASVQDSFAKRKVLFAIFNVSIFALGTKPASIEIEQDNCGHA